MQMQLYQFLFGNKKFNVASTDVQDAWSIAMQMCDDVDRSPLTMLPFVDKSDFAIDMSDGMTIH